jgi:hypothetical protein
MIRNDRLRSRGRVVLELAEHDLRCAHERNILTIRPNGERTEILNLPYEGKGRGYAILDDMFGASRQG